ncbi:MarR family winged helix-turn-helix transcriptional regulator [Xanthovirga aplysinae]|uniref:MarR family winged helix-turn-helix transcriptional regulator n=1 Tax=Xanthovirga aplysinae TaxID=2529853 RepID=UPI0012BCF104|nr:MarR family winged helix-turn-helix transcriptional regulator [Xanthovirga aplysinae]MTI31792.1 MarR family transcriptional regulator [Xanthovirga aplysinae]
MDKSKEPIYGRNIARVYHNMVKMVNEMMCDVELQSGQITYLSNLNKFPGINLMQLGEKAMVNKPTVTKNIKILEKVGIVRKERDPNDLRNCKLYLTDYGLQVEKKLQVVLKELNERLMDGFSEEEQDVLRDFLERLKENTK